jgi:hypothetical protein
MNATEMPVYHGRLMTPSDAGYIFCKILWNQQGNTISLLKPIMKRKISLAAIVLLTVSLASAQTKKEKVPPPPPPAPPVLNIAPPPPPTPPPPPKKSKTSIPDDYKAFLKRNPDVKNIGWSENNIVRIHLKSGKDEVYDLNDKDQVQKLESKYGKLPVAPPPPKPLPPPPPPKAPKAISEEI